MIVGIFCCCNNSPEDNNSNNDGTDYGNSDKDVDDVEGHVVEDEGVVCGTGNIDGRCLFAAINGRC